jgi:DNA-binding XRE family transcriptional regulator
MKGPVSPKEKTGYAHKAKAIGAKQFLSYEPAERTVAAVRQSMNVTQEVFARLVGSSTRTIAEIERGKKPSSSMERAMTEAWRLYEHLSEIIEKADFATWLRKPNPVFGGRQPLQLIEDGRSDELWRMVYELESGQLA